jgi:two-component system sensor histidine kinase MtrB
VDDHSPAPLRPWQRLGLRARITLAFASGGLVLSAVLAGATLYLTRQNLLNQREDAAIELLCANQVNLGQRLTTEISGSTLDAIVESLASAQGSSSIVIVGTSIRSSSAGTFSSEDIPRSLLQLVTSGTPGRIRTSLGGEPTLVVGTPVRPASLPDDLPAQYYAAFPLGDIQDTLHSLSYILGSASAVTAGLAAVLGIWTSRRMLRPLTEASAAAEAIASGNLAARMAAPADRDLASLAASFNEMAGALQERIERDSRFASEVSHELRSPLMTLTASVEVLETRRDDLPERAQTAVDLLSSDLQRFKQLVEDLLEISRFDIGTARLDLEEINLVEFVRQATLRASDRSIPVVYEPAMAHTSINADKRRLARVIQNLIENAAKYGDGATRIEVADLGQSMQIAVEDSGTGVPMEERIVIFDRFSRGGAGGRRGTDSGVGLGLALVSEHVHLHGGRVWVEDKPDGSMGARFVVELPIDPEAAR